MKKRVPWTDEELELCIVSYLKMLGKQTSGKGYIKADYRRELLNQEEFKRSEGAFERRCSNISSVLADLNHPWLKGYKPAKNIGPNMYPKFLKILSKYGIPEEKINATDSAEQLERFVSYIRSSIIPSHEKPKGNKYPKKTATLSSTYVRCPYVVAYVLNIADGVCEACSKDAPFTRKNGTPYLEVHHVLPLEANGPDTVCNAVALCPNCHKRCHFSKDAARFTKKIYKKIVRLKKI